MNLPKPVLMMGWNQDWLTALDEILPESSVVVLEEPNIYAGKRIAQRWAGHKVVNRVIFSEYQQSDRFLAEVAALQAGQPVRAILPALEYSVEAAARAAEELGLPGAGVAAARVFRDKIAQRSVCASAGIAVPRFAEVTDAAGVTAFARDAGSFVVKPANRQASLGVVIVHSGDSPAEAWRECVEADEGPQVAQREFRWRYLVEEYLRGQEYSVEALVVGGEIVFSNVTAKRVQPGRHPIECGHVVPAPPAPAVAELSRLTQALARAVQFGTGLLHAEWIIRDEIPVLVECAARPAGDWIFDLIRQVTGVNLYSAAVNALAGELLQLVPAAQLDGPERTPCAAVRFAVPSGPGVVSDVSGIDAASSAPNVISVPLVKGAGDVIRTVDSSWCRLAAVIAAGSDAASAEAAAAEGLARISVRLDDIGD